MKLAAQHLASDWGGIWCLTGHSSLLKLGNSFQSCHAACEKYLYFRPIKFRHSLYIKENSTMLNWGLKDDIYTVNYNKPDFVLKYSGWQHWFPNNDLLLFFTSTPLYTIISHKTHICIDHAVALVLEEWQRPVDWIWRTGDSTSCARNHFWRNVWSLFPLFPFTQQD